MIPSRRAKGMRFRGLTDGLQDRRLSASRPAERSDAQRRASGTCYRISGNRRLAACVGQPRRLNGRNIDAMKSGRRSANQRLMRTSKAEEAMSAAGLVGSVRRRLRRRVLRVVQAKFEARRVVMRLRYGRETAKRNEQALRGDRIGHRDAYQRSQEPLELDAQSKFSAHANNSQPHFISLRRRRLYTTLRSKMCVRLW